MNKINRPPALRQWGSVTLRQSICSLRRPSLLQPSLLNPSLLKPSLLKPSLLKPLSIAVLTVMVATAANPSLAADYSDLEEVLRKQKELIDQQRASLEEQRKILQSQGEEIETLKTGLEKRTVADRPEEPPQPQAQQQRVVNSPQQQPAAASQPVARRGGSGPMPEGPVGAEPPPIFNEGQAVDIPPINDTVGGVLTGKGRFILEPSFSYSYTDNNRVFLDGFTFLPALAVGLIDLREIKRHSSIATISGRYGVSNRMEVELKVPYVYRSDQQRSRPISVGVADDEIFEADGEGIGDVQLAMRYQLNNGSSGWPVVIANLAASFDTGSSPFQVDYVQSTPGAVFPTELPTGAGYRSIQPGLSLLYATDPGVFFGSINYSWNEKTDEIISDIKSTVDPGDSLGIGFGMGFAFNERSSFSLGYSHKHVFESEIDGQAIEGSVLDIGQLSIGYSLRASQKTSFNLSVTLGTTEDAQDVGLSMRMPMSF